MLSDTNCLLDQMVEIFWNLWCKSCLLQDSQNLLSRNALDGTNSVGITQNDTDLSWSQTLSCELADHIVNLVFGHLQP